MGTTSSIQVGEYRVRIGHQIGEGGYAYIYAAEDDHGKKYALKKVIVPSGT